MDEPRACRGCGLEFSRKGIGMKTGEEQQSSAIVPVATGLDATTILSAMRLMLFELQRIARALESNRQRISVAEARDY
jgi:hypothetical protein